MSNNEKLQYSTTYDVFADLETTEVFFKDANGEFQPIEVKPNRRGYLKCQIPSCCKAPCHSSVGLHRIIADIAFGPCPEGMEVRHCKNGKHDCRPSNLCYGTKSQNQCDRGEGWTESDDKEKAYYRTYNASPAGKARQRVANLKVDLQGAIANGESSDNLAKIRERLEVAQQTWDAMKEAKKLAKALEIINRLKELGVTVESITAKLVVA